MYIVSVEEYTDDIVLATFIDRFEKLESALHCYTCRVVEYTNMIAKHNMLGKSFRLSFCDGGKEVYALRFADMFGEL